MGGSAASSQASLSVWNPTVAVVLCACGGGHNTMAKELSQRHYKPNKDHNHNNNFATTQPIASTVNNHHRFQQHHDDDDDPQNKKKKKSAAAVAGRPLYQAKFSGWRKFVGVLLLVYYAGMMTTRYQHRGYYAFADTLWACNLNILLAAGAILFGCAPLLGATINSVIIPHALWVIDAISYVFTGGFPIGLAAYIAWPETSFAELISSTHHIWFVPLTLAILHKNGGVPLSSWPISVGLIFPVLMASLLFPEEIILENGEPYYLNLNMAHGWWRDMNGWPFSLFPKFNPQYQIFLNLFMATQFTIAFVVLKFVAQIFIKPH